ncbi:hypothetical protein V8E36_005571 [Tilletia maclaganii]
MQFYQSIAILTAFLVPGALALYDNGTNLPPKTDAAYGQTGFNDCQSRWGAFNQSSKCQNVYLRSATEFCLWAPAQPGSTIGDEEANVISWCTMPGYGTRIIPDGTLKGVHFLRTPSFVQVTGRGGELDHHGATGAGNPVGGLVFTDAFTGGTGKMQRIYEWNEFLSSTGYSIRACVGPNAKKFCPHEYDLQGSQWNEPANYDDNVFEDCQGKEGSPPGIYTKKNGQVSTWHQGIKPTPPAQPAGASSSCTRYATISNGAGIKRRDGMRAVEEL